MRLQLLLLLLLLLLHVNPARAAWPDAAAATVAAVGGNVTAAYITPLGAAQAALHTSTVVRVRTKDEEEDDEQAEDKKKKKKTERKKEGRKERKKERKKNKERKKKKLEGRKLLLFAFAI